MKFDLEFFAVQDKLPNDSEPILMQVDGLTNLGFITGTFYEGFKADYDTYTADGSRDITEYVISWAYLPDFMILYNMSKIST